MIGSRRRNRRDTFDSVLDVVEADVMHHAGAHALTEVVPVVQDSPTVTLVADREPEPAAAEVAPEPEPEVVLPDAGYVVLPTLWAQWPHLFGRVPMPLEPTGEAEATPEPEPEPLFTDDYPKSDTQVIKAFAGDDCT